MFISTNIHFQLRFCAYIYKHTLSATALYLHLETYPFIYGSVYTSANMDALYTVTNICSYDSFACICTLQQQILASTILFATPKMHSEVTHICSYNPVFVYANNHLATANISSFVSIFISANMHVAVTTLCSKECETVATTSRIAQRVASWFV